MKYQAIIFDLDGTLLNTLDDLCAAGNRVSLQNGWPEYTMEQFRTKIGHGIYYLVGKLIPEEVEHTQELLEATKTQFRADYSAHCLDYTVPYPGIPELLKKLQADGVRMAVFTNKPDGVTQTIIDHFFPGVFEFVRGTLPGVPVKPDPSGAKEIVDALGVTASNTIFVGDSSVDMNTGHNLGLPVCGVSWGYRTRSSLVDAGADFLADTVEELEAILCG